MKNMYINTWQWGRGSIAFSLHASFIQHCNRAVIKVRRKESRSVNTSPCTEDKTPKVKTEAVLCRVPTATDDQPSKPVLIEPKHDLTASPVPLVRCLSGHVTLVALACDRDSLCTEKLERRRMSRSAKCKAAPTQVTPYLRCEATGEYVPYTVVCNWRQDCRDNSDESFCQFPPCAKNTFTCGRGQCISVTHVCDNYVDCRTARDEQHCDSFKSVKTVFSVTDPPALVNFDRPGSFSVIPHPGNTTRCPDTHFHCPGNGYCLPVYTRCNGMFDCPGHEDETGCAKFTCLGLYRCRGKDREICLHADHLCDGWPQCPQQDDELMCGTDSCPDHCVCYGLSFTDRLVFQPDTFPKLRYLEGRGSDTFVGTCRVPEDEISSCDNLLKYGSYRAVIVIFIMTALLGNICSIVYRIWSFSSKTTGQALIYWSVRANTMSGHGSNSKENVVIKDKTRSKEATIARRLLVIAMEETRSHKTIMMFLSSMIVWDISGVELRLPIGLADAFLELVSRHVDRPWLTCSSTSRLAVSLGFGASDPSQTVTEGTTDPELEKILNEAAELFEESRGTIKGVQANIFVDHTAQPHYFKLRPVPYALRGKVGQELDRLESEGTLEKVQFSDWAAPIVTVVKPD
ncbi:uncharacterized protein LOC143276044 [Babylonia areolata]|uniref:uncharacterized protein LOC143276044 n=1 Tax=Babylonia areolata TaxID=304850 RepID=UPI003FD2AC33